jgi:hypothetical protein
MVAAAVARRVTLEKLLVSGGGGAELFHSIVPDDLLLYRQALAHTVIRSGRGLAGQRQRDAALGEHVVRSVDEVQDLGHPNVGHGLVHDHLGLNGCNANFERSAKHGRYSRSASQAIIDAGCTIRRIRTSSWLSRSTSSKAKFSKISINSGSVTFRLER